MTAKVCGEPNSVLGPRGRRQARAARCGGARRDRAGRGRRACRAGTLVPDDRLHSRLLDHLDDRGRDRRAAGAHGAAQRGGEHQHEQEGNAPGHVARIGRSARSGIPRSGDSGKIAARSDVQTAVKPRASRGRAAGSGGRSVGLRQRALDGDELADHGFKWPACSRVHAPLRSTRRHRPSARVDLRRAPPEPEDVRPRAFWGTAPGRGCPSTDQSQGPLSRQAGRRTLLCRRLRGTSSARTPRPQLVVPDARRLGLALVRIGGDEGRHRRPVLLVLLGRRRRARRAEGGVAARLGIETRTIMGNDPPGSFTRVLHPRHGRHGEPPADVIPVGRSVIVPGERRAAEHRPEPAACCGSSGARRERFDVLHLHEPMTPVDLHRGARLGALPGGRHLPRLRRPRLAPRGTAGVGVPDGPDRPPDRRLRGGPRVGRELVPGRVRGDPERRPDPGPRPSPAAASTGSSSSAGTTRARGCRCCCAPGRRSTAAPAPACGSSAPTR